MNLLLESTENNKRRWTFW